MGVTHLPECQQIPLSLLVEDADAEGNPVPDAVRRGAERGAVIKKCVHDCPVLAAATDRGKARVIAEWQEPV